MESVVYKIGEVSARLGLVDKNSNTLRGWAEEFGEFLSALANPAPGQPRRFTERDLQVLTAIRDYRANHLTYDEIRERLRAGAHDVTPLPGEDARSAVHEASDGQALAPVAQLERLLAPLAASVDEWRRLAEEYRGRLEAREARIETLERRIADLYARLDTPPGPVSPSSGAEGEIGAASTPLNSATPNGHDRAGANGAIQIQDMGANGAIQTQDMGANGAVQAQDTDGASLFPLPVVERLPHDQEPVPAAPRRRWWQVWR